MLELTDGFQERLALDIAHRAAHLDNGDTGLFVRIITIKTVFDLVCNMGNYLHGTSAKVSAALFLQYGPVDFSGSHVGILIKIFVDESLIMTKIQVSLAAIVSNENFTVLDRVHGTRVDIDIGVKFLHGNFVSAGF